MAARRKAQAAVRRDKRGRILPGSKLNPGGRNGYGDLREVHENVRRLLYEDLPPKANAALLKLAAPEVRAFLTALGEGTSPAKVLAAVVVARAISGDHHAIGEVLRRVWPATEHRIHTMDDDLAARLQRAMVRIEGRSAAD